MTAPTTGDDPSASTSDPNTNNTTTQQDDPSIYLQQPHHQEYARQTYGIILHQTRMVHNKDESQRGTIHYVGPVASASNQTELYAGVIWDDVTKGKHNGTALSKTTGQFVRHFHVPPQLGPTAASFVKLTKLALGRPLNVALVREKYVAAADPRLVAPGNQFDTEQVYVQTTRGQKKAIEFWGELKIRQQQQIGQLTTVALRRCAICNVESTKAEDWEINEVETTQNEQEGDATNNDDTTKTRTISATASIQKLDLAGNLLAQWHHVADILKTFENLEELNLASNRLQDIALDDNGNQNDKDNTTSPLLQILSDSDSSIMTWSNLQALNLRSCHISTLQTLVALGTALPNLTSLCLSDNPLRLLEQAPIDNENHDNDNTITMPGSTIHVAQQLAQRFANLKTLDVSECQLATPSEFAIFSQLPQLEFLDFDDNPIGVLPTRAQIQTLQPTPDGSSSQPSIDFFPRLRHLQLAGTQIETWHALDETLRQDLQTTLQSIRFDATPLQQSLGSYATMRSHFIARYAQLTKFNGTPVQDHERTDAERRYVGTVARLLATQYTNATERDAFLQREHARYKELAEQHETAARAAVASSNGGGGQSTGMLSDSLLNLTLQSMAAQSCEKAPLQRRLPSTLTVAKIKALLARQFGLDVDLQELSYSTSSQDKNNAIPLPLDRDDADLAYFGVPNLSTIYMHEKTTKGDMNNIDSANGGSELLQRLEQQESEMNDFLQRKQKIMS